MMLIDVAQVVSALHGQLPFSQAASGERVSFVLPTLPNISDFVSIHKKAVGQGPQAMDVEPVSASLAA
eukprot:COSAG01_NODE_14827_length_1405_cov_1.530628_1_plen_68_part_00